MAVITTEKLSATVGALVDGVDRERLLARRRPPGLDARGARGQRRARVPRPPPRRRGPGGVQPQARQGREARQGRAPGDLPGHPRPGQEPVGAVPQGHLRLAHRRLHRRHPDHGHDAQRPRRGRVRRRDRVRQHATPPTRTSPTTRRQRLESRPGRAHDRGLAAPAQPRPLRRGGRDAGARRPAKEHPLVWTHRSGRRSLVLGATTDHVVGMDRDEGRALLARPPRPGHHPRPRVPPRVGSWATS